MLKVALSLLAWVKKQNLDVLGIIFFFCFWSDVLTKEDSEGCKENKNRLTSKIMREMKKEGRKDKKSDKTLKRKHKGKGITPSSGLHFLLSVAFTEKSRYAIPLIGW